jgi:hypothetical protein
VIPNVRLDLIPQTDPRASYIAQQPAIDHAISRVLLGGRYILGREVEARLIEDCAQSHGALYRGRPTGSFGDIGAL